MSERLTSAMILAAGLGTRMRPLTLSCPKPLITVHDKTMADHALERLVEANIKTVILNVSYLADQIVSHFQDYHTPDIRFSHEAEPLETGGGVTKALPLLEGEAFYVMNGDAIVVDATGHQSLMEMQKVWHNIPGLDALLLLHPKDKAIGFDGCGDFFFTPEAGLAFRGVEPKAPYVFTGVQILSRRAFAGRAATSWSLREIYQDAIEKGTAGAVVHQGDWLHVGTPDGRQLAERYFQKAIA